MASMFLSEWDEHLGRVSQALLATDAHELRMHAHTLKSLLAMFHAEQARRLAMDMEGAAMPFERVDWKNCQQLFTELVDEMAAIRPALEQFVETRVIP
jgi:two-component system, sensor histidine kinase and response regulator